jgi:arylsulfatase A-like enzyme
VFVISADHGSSFRYAPLRDSLVNNRYEENYHIPCLIYGNGIQPKENANYYTTKDIVKTMLVSAGVASEKFHGADILSGQRQDYAITEYLGGGCPDIFRKPLLLTVRNDEYCVGISRKLSEDFSKSQIVCVYDRQNDPSELHNIVAETGFEKIETLVAVVNARFDEIKKQADKKFALYRTR